MSLHLTKTDNTSIADKVELRKKATEHLPVLKVLDLYAGKNVLWSSFAKERYYGIDIEKGKGKNLCADSKRVIAALDLCDFNVIDCDSYGIPFDTIYKLFNNPTLKEGTVIIYTAITNRLSGTNKECLKMFNLQKIYAKCRNLAASQAMPLFHGMLQKYGVKEIAFYEVKDNFVKQYGFFVVNHLPKLTEDDKMSICQ